MFTLAVVLRGFYGVWHGGLNTRRVISFCVGYMLCYVDGSKHYSDLKIATNMGRGWQGFYTRVSYPLPIVPYCRNSYMPIDIAIAAIGKEFFHALGARAGEEWCRSSFHLDPPKVTFSLLVHKDQLPMVLA